MRFELGVWAALGNHAIDSHFAYTSTKSPK